MRRSVRMLRLATLVLASTVAAYGQSNPAKEGRPGLLARGTRAALARVFVTIGGPLVGTLDRAALNRSPVIGGAAVIALGEIGNQHSAYVLRYVFESAPVEKRVLVCQALAKMNDRESVSFLLRASRHDSSPDARAAASRALDDIGNTIGEDSLVAVLDRDRTGLFAKEEALALAHIATSRALVTVEDWLQRPRHGMGEFEIINSLADLEQPIAVRLLGSVTRDTTFSERQQAYYALSMIDSSARSIWLSRAMVDPDPHVRQEAIRTLGNNRDSATAVLLVAATHDPAPVVRAAAVRYLRLRPGVRDVIVAALSDTSAQVRDAAVECLSFDTSAAATSALSIALGHRDPATRAAVLGRSEWPLPRRFAVSQLTAGLSDSSRKVRLAAIEALRSRGDTAAVLPLIGVLSDTIRAVRLHAVEALGYLADSRAAPALLPMVRDADPQTRTGAIWAIGRTGGPGAAEAVLSVLNEGAGDEQWWAVARLGRLRYGPAVVPLIGLLGDGRSRFRQVAAWALGRIGDTTAADALGPAVGDKDAAAADLAAQALLQLGEPGIRVLTSLLRDSSLSVQRTAARALASAKLVVADSALLEAAERKDFVVVAEAYRFYLDRNEPALDRVLAEAMAKNGTSDMWSALSRSGRPMLEHAAQRWNGPHWVGLHMGNDCVFVNDYDWQDFNYRN